MRRGRGSPENEFRDPEIVRRFWRRWHLRLTMPAFLLMAASIALNAMQQMQAALLVTLVGLGLLLPLTIVKWFRYRRLLRRAMAHDFALCTGCAYSLIGVARQGACPECGLPYDIEASRRRWRAARSRRGRDLGSLEESVQRRIAAYESKAASTSDAKPPDPTHHGHDTHANAHARKDQ